VVVWLVVSDAVGPGVMVVVAEVISGGALTDISIWTSVAFVHPMKYTGASSASSSSNVVVLLLPGLSSSRLVQELVILS